MKCVECGNYQFARGNPVKCKVCGSDMRTVCLENHNMKRHFKPQISRAER